MPRSRLAVIISAGASWSGAIAVSILTLFAGSRMTLVDDAICPFLDVSAGLLTTVAVMSRLVIAPREAYRLGFGAGERKGRRDASVVDLAAARRERA